MTVYLRRNGKMMFWRIGRLGGSVYLARASRVDDETKSIERALLRIKRRREREAARMWHRWGAGSRVWMN